MLQQIVLRPPVVMNGAKTQVLPDLLLQFWIEPAITEDETEILINAQLPS